MKNRFLFQIFFVFILTQSIQAQSDSLNKIDASGKKQGHWIKLTAEKKKIYEGNFVDDIPVGRFKYYRDADTPWSITVFSHMGKVAHTQMFSAAGNLIATGKYVSEKKDSVWKYYDKDVKLISTENYTNGVKNGLFIVYFPSGDAAEEKTWKNGVLDGPCIKYFDGGQVKQQWTYVNNKVEGKAVFYFPSGKVNIEGVYKNDLKDGPWKYYKEDGTLDRTDDYQNGLFVGKKDPNIIPKEQVEKEKKQSEQFEVIDPFQDK